MTPEIETRLTKAKMTAVIDHVSEQLRERYVFAEAGEVLSRHLQDRLVSGTFDAHTRPSEFAQAVTAQMFAISQDQHLRLWYDPAQATAAGDESGGEELLRRHFQRAQRANFGFARAERLAGNIGYLDLRELPPVEVAGDIAAGAMAFLANTRALIIDLRHNAGGSPDMVQFLASYLFDEEPRQLSGIVSRQRDAATAFETLSNIPGRRLPDVDVYVLTSGFTHSAAEALAYDLQALQRATIIGEKTRGGAHLVDYQAIDGQYMFTLPTARAVNPITGSNWEGSGVRPDVELPQEEALSAAHRQALARLLALASTDDERRFLRWELETLEARLNPVTVDETLLRQYAGVYAGREIILEGDKLYYRQFTRLPLMPLTEDTYYLRDDTRLRFVRDKQGAISELVMLDRDGGEELLPREG